MFALSFLPLNSSDTKQLNGIEQNIILNILQTDDFDSHIQTIINIELTIEQDISLTL
jgi:hypothetical protein